MTPPKCPPSFDRRAHRRVELLAQVQLRHGDKVHILRTLNLSQGGVFLCGTLEQLPPVEYGSLVDLLIFCPEESEEDVAVSARVVRVEATSQPGRPAGLALVFVHLDSKNNRRLKKLLSR